MQFLLIGTISSAGKAASPDEMATLKMKEQETAQDYYHRGLFRQIWTIKDGAAVVCEAETRENLEEHIAVLPLVKAGFLDVTLHKLDAYARFNVI